jgi:hypothetical protein
MMNIGDLARLGSLGPSGWLGWLVYIRGALMATTKQGGSQASASTMRSQFLSGSQSASTSRTQHTLQLFDRVLREVTTTQNYNVRVTELQWQYVSYKHEHPTRQS